MSARIKKTSPQPIIQLAVPVMDQKRFAEQSGLRQAQIYGQVTRSNLPIIKVGRFALINMAKLTLEQHAHLRPVLITTPVMTAEEFGLHAGLEKHQVQHQLEQGNLPRRAVGRLVLVDIVELTKMCLSAEDE